jgi:hypothetical protein
LLILKVKKLWFFSNKGAVAGVFTVVGVVALVLLIARRRERDFNKELDAATREAAAAAPNPMVKMKMKICSNVVDVVAVQGMDLEQVITVETVILMFLMVPLVNHPWKPII